MKAIAINRYGGPETLEYTDLPEPKVGPDVVLIRVKAAGINPVDWKVREGYLDGVFPSHFPLVPGWDVAGVVERVGPAVTEFSPGDEVVAYDREDHIQNGTYAEFTAAPVRTVARKPQTATWAQAGGLPLVGLTAHQLLEALDLRQGETVLVHAASGGVGSMAVQLARLRGVHVIGTASERNHDYLRELGAQPVSYGDGLVERVHELAPDGVDAAVELLGGETLESTPELLGPLGRFASVSDPARALELGGRYIFVRPNAEQLALLARYVDEGSLRVDVTRTLPLAEAAEAHRISQEGHARGKIVLEVG